jgi:hypothetical protein
VLELLEVATGNFDAVKAAEGSQLYFDPACVFQAMQFIVQYPIM